MMAEDIVLSDAELVRITGYKRPAEQLAELHRQGFHRARRSPRTGGVILERAHYDAVCAGQALTIGPAPPRLRPPRLRAA